MAHPYDPPRFTQPRAFEFVVMEPHSLGEWVHWKDYVLVVDQLRSEIADLKRSRGVVDAEAEKLVQQRDALTKKVSELEGYREVLAEQLAERVRRHESDGRDLDQLRITVRDESNRAHEAELQVDALADALVAARSFLQNSDEFPDEQGACQIVESALKLVGRLP